MPMNPAEILTSPFEAWIADVAASPSAVFPDVDGEPDPAHWILLGKNGSRNYEEGGVTLEMNQTTNDIFVAGSTGPVKKTRTQETLSVSFVLLDWRPEMFSHVINGRAIETVPGNGSAGHKSLGLFRGTEMTEYMLLLRGRTASPELLGAVAQFEVPRAVQTGSPSAVFAKGVPAGLAFQFDAMEDLTEDLDEEFRFGRFRVMHDAGTGS